MTDPIILRLHSTEEARRSFRRGALRYSATKCREWGFMGAALELERYASFIGDPDDDTEVNVGDVVVIPEPLDHFEDPDETRPAKPFRTSSLNRVFTDLIALPEA